MSSDVKQLTAQGLASSDIEILAEGINKLIVRYCNAIDECASIPRISILPIISLYFGSILWVLCLELACVTLPIDGLLILIQWLLRRDLKLLIGRKLYDFLIGPFKRANRGDISWFKFSRTRYLTVILLAYHAQSRLKTLTTVLNTKYLRAIIDDTSAEDLDQLFQKLKTNLSLFDDIANGSYKFGIFLVGGPVIAILSILFQHLVLPLMTYLWKIFSGITLTTEQIGEAEAFIIYFVVITLWIIVSAWLDMRALLVGSHIYRLEHGSFSAAKVKYNREIPWDLLWFFMCLAATSPTFYFFMTKHTDFTANDISLYVKTNIIITYGIFLLPAAVIGSIAAVRRIQFDEDRLVPADIE
jgi:hypothetical protein